MKSVTKASTEKPILRGQGIIHAHDINDLDNCCRGKNTFSESLSNDSNELFEVIKEMNILNNEFNKNSDRDTGKLSLSELIDHILITNHHYIKEYGLIIYTLLKKISEKYGSLHPELEKISELFAEVKRDLDQHMMNEEIILFPRLKQIDSYFNNKVKRYPVIIIESPIHVMEDELEIAMDIISEIKKLANNFSLPDNACSTYRMAFEELKQFEENLVLHVHLEKNILFPKAISIQQILNSAIPE